MNGFEEWEEISEEGESLQGDITEADLDQIAADFNPETHEARGTDRLEDNEPSSAWVEALRREGLFHKIRFLSPYSPRKILTRSGSK